MNEDRRFYAGTGSTVKRWLLRIAILMVPVTVSAAEFQCPSVQPPPRTMGIETRYVAKAKDPTFSIIDPVQEAEQLKVRSKITRPIYAIVKLADSYDEVVDAAQKALIGGCLESHFAALAAAGAMADAQSDSDFFFRDWMVTTLALAYLKAAPYLDTESSVTSIKGWFAESAQGLMSFHQRRLDKGIVNNHLYWGGLAVASVSYVINDETYREFGRKVLHSGLKEIDETGLMQAELKRGKLSLHYHIFAATPLAAIIALNSSNHDNDKYPEMRRLAVAIIDEINSDGNGAIARYTGTVQSQEDHPSQLYLLRRFLQQDNDRTTALNAILQNVPARYVFLGGNLDFLLER